MTTQNKTFITFDEFVFEVGIPRKREETDEISARYLYLNQALDIVYENPKIHQEKVVAMIAKEQNVSAGEVEQNILYAIKEIQSRKNQKEKFIEIFGNGRKQNMQRFLGKIVEAYRNETSSKTGPSL